PTTPVTCLKRMRLPLLAATISMCFLLVLDMFVLGPGNLSVEDKAEQQQNVEDSQDKDDRKALRFSQEDWDNVQESDDWDQIFDSAAWSSLLFEGYVGANVKDEPPLRRVRNPGGGAGGKPAIPKDGSLKQGGAAKTATAAVISLNLDGGAVPPSEALSGKAAKKKKKAKKSETSGPPEVLDKFEPVPTKADWFHTSWKRSATYGMSKVFVEDEPLYKACASDVVVQRSWRETFLTLGPFGYMGRSKNPCWYPKDAKFTCIPHFFLAGAAGPGTADVMRKIMIHPYVLGHAEQIYWWDLGRHEGKTWDWYRENFQKEIDQILLDINDHKSSSKVFGDGTNTYFAAPTGWERLSGNENCQEPRITLASHIRRLRVKGLVIVVLPHPTRRMLAEFRMLSKGKVNPSQFHQYLVQAVKTYKDCFAKYSLRQCAYNKTVADSVKISLHEGMYSIYMEDWKRIFPPEQFKVIRFEDYVMNMVPTLESLYTFVGLPQVDPSQLAIAANPNTKEFRELVRNHNAGSFLPESIKMLNEFYEPFLKVLGEVMEDPKFTFKDT
ncbi:hypothetical protein BaRGS_00004235, partial [Batillaria attramentaria]